MNRTEHNLNDRMRVKLLPRGMDVIKAERERMSREMPSQDWSRWWEPDADGYLESQAWEIMHLFGEACYMGTTTAV
jgi:hypothetical protein